MSKVRLAAIACVFAAICCFTPLAYAQATRTWVSGVGDDVNPCSRTAPCKTFAGAISKTANAGEIDTLDPGGFGAVTITKSITIDGTAGLAGIASCGVTAINVNAPATAVVIIRNLDLLGCGAGLVPPGPGGGNPGIHGINIFAAADVRVEKCKIFGFSQRGILDQRTAGRLVVTNTMISNNGQTGIVAVPSVAGASTLQISLDNVRLDGHGNSGIALTSGAKGTVAHSIASGNTSFGFYADSNSTLNLTDCVSSGNGTGVTSQSGATVRLSNTTVTANGTGLNTVGGSILSYGINRIDGNTAGNGPPTGGLLQQ